MYYNLINVFNLIYVKNQKEKYQCFNRKICKPFNLCIKGTYENVEHS